MRGQLADDGLHVARGLGHDDARLLGVEHGDHGVGRVVENGTLGDGDAHDLVGDGRGGLAEGDEDDLVGQGAGAGGQLAGGVGAFGDDKCFHGIQPFFECYGLTGDAQTTGRP